VSASVPAELPAAADQPLRIDAAETFAGEPDSYGRLWTPHRLVYIRGENKPTNADAGEQCPFCRVPGGSDVDGLIVARGRLVFAVLNLYPYNSGHLMVVPYRHVANYDELTDAEVGEFGAFTQISMRALRRTSAPDGFNIGMNQSPAAGAGIAAHLHQHVVPRWSGDTNFMPIVAATRVLPELLSQARLALANAWPVVAQSVDVPSEPPQPQ
jgi:ATP adenylyltransferase